ncbi:CcmD-like small membrane protein [Wolbachia endosymbiont of Cruorifilaria tuberocauda]
MSTYVILAYLISFVLIVGELIFTVSCYIRSKETLRSLKDNNEKKI